jgi:hypothetical protein
VTVFGTWPVQISAGTPTALSEICRGFPQLRLANTGIVPPVRPRRLPFTSFPVHYSLILPFYAM